VFEISWELFEECFREFYLSTKFIERQLNDFNSLRHNSRSIPKYESRFMELLKYAPHLNTKILRVKKIIYGLNYNIISKDMILILIQVDIGGHPLVPTGSSC
jgi:hypothetical protein